MTIKKNVVTKHVHKLFTQFLEQLDTGIDSCNFQKHLAW